FAHQPGDGGRLFFIRPHPEQFLQQIDVGVAVEDVGRLVLLYDLCLFVLIAALADDLFDQIFDRDQATDTAVLINHDGHANIVALHLAQQFAPQLGFGNEVHIGFHQVANGLAVRLDIGNLQQVLGIDDAFDVIDIALVHRYARVGMFLHQIRKFVDRRADWNSDDLRPRRHNLPHRFVAELNHRLDEVAVALPQNAFFLAGFDQRVNRFRWMLWLLLRVFLGERRNGKSETKNERGWQSKINQHSQYRHPMPQPFASGAHEENVRQQAIEDHNDKDQADRRLYQIEHHPALFHEQHIADEHSDAGHADLR